MVVFLHHGRWLDVLDGVSAAGVQIKDTQRDGWVRAVLRTTEPNNIVSVGPSTWRDVPGVLLLAPVVVFVFLPKRRGTYRLILVVYSNNNNNNGGSGGAG